MWNLTRAEFIWKGLAALGASTVSASSMTAVGGESSAEGGGDGAPEIRLDTLIANHGHDDTRGFLAFIDALNRGASRTGIIPAGRYRLDADRLANAAAVVIRDGVTIRGEGAAILIVDGATVVPAILRFRNCAGRVENITFIGNGQGTGYTNGSAVHFTVDTTSARSVDFAEIVGCVFDNFKSTAWVYVYVNSRSFGIDRVAISRNIVRSRAGNSIAPAALGMRASAFELQSKFSASDGGGGIRNVTIRDNVIDATHIKSGIFLSDKVQGCRVAGNRVTGAGVSGATDDAGGYAIAAYDSDGTGMERLSLADNRIDAVRSAGVYCAGLRDVTIDGLVGSNQSDHAEASLPKGLIVLNGVSSFAVGQVSAKAIAGSVIHVVPARRGTQGTITDIEAVGAQRAVYLVATFGPSSIKVSDIRARDCAYGVLGNIVGSGTAGFWTITRLDIRSAMPGSAGVRIFAEGSPDRVPEVSIGGDTTIATRRVGVEIPRLTVGAIVVKDVTFDGDFSVAAIMADGARHVSLDQLSFENQKSGGFSMSLTGAQGTTGSTIAFRNVADGHAVRGLRHPLRLSAPFTGD